MGAVIIDRFSITEKPLKFTKFKVNKLIARLY